MVKSFSLGKYALSGGVAVALLAGCGGSQLPIGAAGPARPTPVAVARASAQRGWMLQRATSGDLVYASEKVSAYGSAVYVYSYPGGELVGELTDFPSGYYPQGLCTDSSGDVFVTTNQNLKSESQSNIYEYAHGGTSPLATLSDPGWALGCAVDPTTGDLAVANASTAGGGSGDVAIYQNARGNPAVYGNFKHWVF